MENSTAGGPARSGAAPVTVAIQAGAVGGAVRAVAEHVCAGRREGAIALSALYRLRSKSSDLSL